MSHHDVRVAFNTHYASLLDPTTINTVDENEKFDPASATGPYETIHMLPGTPENAAMGSSSGVWRVGFFQVTLYYPAGQGTKAAALRAQAIAARFARGTTLTSGSITVKLTKPVDIKRSRLEGERYVLPVQIPFLAFDA